MKHKVGDKVFIKGKVINNSQFGECRVEILNSTDDDLRYMWFKDEDLEEPGSEMTAEEAWEIARKITVTTDFGGYNGYEFQEIFDTAASRCVMKNFTFTEAKEKIEAWKKSKEEIIIGDVYEHKDYDYKKCIVTSIFGDEIYYINFDGSCSSCNRSKFNNLYFKTGKHIDITSLLKQISE